MPNMTAIVPAAGLGSRFAPAGGGASKPFHALGGKPLVLWVLEALEASPEVAEIIPVFRPEDMEEGDRLIEGRGFSKINKTAAGGRQRQDSVLNGLRLVGDPSSAVLVHDGARPFLDEALIRNTLEGLSGFDGAVAAVPPKDTIKEAEVGEAAVVGKTLDRALLWAVQTPQVFPYAVVMAAFEQAAEEGFYATDDSALVERRGGRVNIVMGSYENIKVTTPEDIHLAEAILKGRQLA